MWKWRSPWEYTWSQQGENLYPFVSLEYDLMDSFEDQGDRRSDWLTDCKLPPHDLQLRITVHAYYDNDRLVGKLHNIWSFIRQSVGSVVSRSIDRSDRLDLELSFAVTGASFLGAVKRLWRLVLLRGLGEGVYSFTHLNVFAASRVYLPILIINRRTCAWMWRGH